MSRVGFEPTSSALRAEAITRFANETNLERTARIELASVPWQGTARPLSYVRRFGARRWDSNPRSFKHRFYRPAPLPLGTLRRELMARDADGGDRVSALPWSHDGHSKLATTLPSASVRTDASRIDALPFIQRTRPLESQNMEYSPSIYATQERLSSHRPGGTASQYPQRAEDYSHGTSVYCQTEELGCRGRN